MLFLGKFFAGAVVSTRSLGELNHEWRHLILNPAGTEGQILIERRYRPVKYYVTSPVTRLHRSRKSIIAYRAETVPAQRPTRGLHGMWRMDGIGRRRHH
jgi:hypothetical protein